MLGLMYLLALLLWLAIALGLMIWGWKLGRKSGGGVLRAMLFSVIGFLLAFVPIFGQAIPTYYIHQQNCKRDAGFKEFVPAQQWREEHKSELSTLKAATPVGGILRSEKLADGSDRDVVFGGAQLVDTLVSVTETWGTKHYRYMVKIRDAKSSEVLAQTTDYSSSQREDARFWLYNPSCFGEYPKSNPVSQYIVYVTKSRGESND